MVKIEEPYDFEFKESKKDIFLNINKEWRELLKFGTSIRYLFKKFPDNERKKTDIKNDDDIKNKFFIF